MSCCCYCAYRKVQTWPSVCGAPAYAVGPQLRWRVGLAAASLAQSAACAGRHQSGEIKNKYQRQVKTLCHLEQDACLFWSFLKPLWIKYKQVICDKQWTDCAKFTSKMIYYIYLPVLIEVAQLHVVIWLRLLQSRLSSLMQSSPTTSILFCPYQCFWTHQWLTGKNPLLSWLHCFVLLELTLPLLWLWHDVWSE